MGEVFKGLSPGGRHVAVKVVHRHLLARDATFRDRFRREMDAVRRVGGFWTAAIVDGDADAPAPWYASAFIDAPTLADRVAEKGSLGELAVTRLAAGLVEVLIAIHKEGLVHRDLKPSNVMMAREGPIVIDFGIVRSELGLDDLPLTQTGNIVGTVGYLAPEQFEGQRATVESDVFALGSSLVFANTGRPAFVGATDAAVVAATVRGEAMLRDVHPAVRRVVEPCLRRAPSDRPSLHQVQDYLAKTLIRLQSQSPGVRPENRETESLAHSKVSSGHRSYVSVQESNGGTSEAAPAVVRHEDRLVRGPSGVQMAGVGLCVGIPGFVSFWLMTGLLAVGIGAAVVATGVTFYVIARMSRAALESANPYHFMDAPPWVGFGAALLVLFTWARVMSINFDLRWWWNLGVAVVAAAVAVLSVLALYEFLEEYTVGPQSDIAVVVGPASAITFGLLPIWLGALPAWGASLSAIAGGLAISVATQRLLRFETGRVAVSEG